MNLNQRQQTILKVLCAYLTITMLWPPFYFGGGGGYNPGLGYGFLFSPPEDGRVDATQLMAQWLLGAIVSGVAILQAKNWTPSEKPGFTQRIGPALKEGFKRSKWWLLYLAVFALIKLVTPSIDQGKQAAFALMIFIGYLPIYVAIWLWHTQRAYRGIQSVVAKPTTISSSLKKISIAVLLAIVIFGAFFALVEGPKNKFWTTNPVIEPASGQFIPDSHQPKGNAFEDLIPHNGPDDKCKNKPWLLDWSTNPPSCK